VGIIERIELVMSADSGFVRPLAVAVSSIARTAVVPCRIHVLHDGIATFDREKVERSAVAGTSVTWVDARDAIAGAELPVRRPPSMYTRLFVGDLLPADLARVIYLDADVVVRRPLDALWSAELGEAPVAAVRDAHFPWVVSWDTVPWRELGLAPEAPFFNSGVMVIAMPEWRRLDVGRRALDLLSASSPMLDQCVLNAVLVGSWTPLAPTWNVQSYHLIGDDCLSYATEGAARLDAALADPAIVHFTVGTFNRPWQAPCSNPYRDEWLAHLDHTPWAGWRPTPVPMARRMWGRARRAARVALHGGK
jgi:lipopolysaccharide biosynthesis glycosyltransferase